MVEMFEVLVEILLALVATSPDTSMMSAALIAPVAVILLALVEMFDVLVEMLEVFVEMLLVFVATSPETSMMSAALIAPVAVIFVALVEMFEVLVEMFEVLVAVSYTHLTLPTNREV